MDENCLTCRRYSRCSYQSKSRNYKCKNYRGQVNDGTLNLSEMFSSVSVIPDKVETGLSIRNNSRLILPDTNIRKAQSDVENMFEEVLNNKSPFPKDIKINDDELPEFCNFYDYFFHPVYGLKLSEFEPFSRQMWIGIKLFADYCPHCTRKYMKSNYMDNIENVPVDQKGRDFINHVQLLEYGVCPRCSRGRADLIKKGRLNLYFEFAGCIGQRAGKSITFSFLESYRTTKYLKMQRPSEVLTGLPNVTLISTYTATDFRTATDTLWKPLMDIIGESIWFKDYHSMLTHYQNKYSEEIFRVMDSFILYNHRKMFMYAAAPNQRNLRGRTRMGSAIDELGHFDAAQESATKIRISADGIYNALKRSHRTVKSAVTLLVKQGYNNVTPNLAVNISSPVSQFDKIMMLVKLNVDSKEILVVHLPTWKFNPKEPRSNFEDEFRTDPIGSDRDYGANPPMTDSPFMSNVGNVSDCFSKTKNKINYEYKFKEVNGQELLAQYSHIKITTDRDIKPSVLAIDAGLTNNSFSVVIGHRDSEKVIFDVILEIAPTVGKSRLAYAAIFKYNLAELIREFNVKAVFADRWNSAMLLDTCREDFKIIADQVSVKYNDFIVFKSYMEGGRIKFPAIEMPVDSIMSTVCTNYPHEFKYKPCAHLLMQCLTVSDTGKTVTKGTNRTDDIFRAAVLAGRYLLNDEWCKLNLSESQKKQSKGGLVAMHNGSNISNAHTSSGGGLGSLIGHNTYNQPSVFTRIKKD